MTALVVRTDSRQLPLADNTVDLVVTSPPYFGLRSYQDAGQHYTGQVGDEATPAEFVDALLAVTAECVRVVKPSGSIWVNLGDKYARAGGGGRGSSDGTTGRGPRPSTSLPDGVREKSLLGLPWRYALACTDRLGLILRAEVIWSKPNGLPESVTDRVRRSHEQWFHFTAEPRYFSAVDEVREAYTAPPFRGQKQHKAGDSGATQNPVLASLTTWDASDYQHNPLGKLPGSVWTIPSQPLQVPAHLGVDHFAAFPMEWPRRLIKGWSPEGGVVLDPFGGTGTTALVAASLGRTGISCDLSHDYSRLARWRTSDPGQRAAAMQVEKPKPELPGQADLFGDVA